MKAIIIMGSTADEPHAEKITVKLDEYNINWEPVSYTHLTLPTKA